MSFLGLNEKVIAAQLPELEAATVKRHHAFNCPTSVAASEVPAKTEMWQLNHDRLHLERKPRWDLRLFALFSPICAGSKDIP
jgi:hypothetical protein